MLQPLVYTKFFAILHAHLLDEDDITMKQREKIVAVRCCDSSHFVPLSFFALVACVFYVCVCECVCSCLWVCMFLSGSLCLFDHLRPVPARRRSGHETVPAIPPWTSLSFTNHCSSCWTCGRTLSPQRRM